MFKRFFGKSLFEMIGLTTKETETPVETGIKILKPTQKNDTEKKTRKGQYNISYRDDLIEMFEDHHSVLAEHGKKLQAAIVLKDYNEANRVLHIFRVALWEHLHQEQLLFYGFFKFMENRKKEHAVKRSWEIYQQVETAKKELAQIGRVVKKFTYEYEGTIGFNNIRKCEQDFAVILEALAKRIEQEEAELYPLYIEFARINNLDILLNHEL